ncbi:hypothetical protein VV02_08835 [Luteipulveratus mongoliensis]|uniref:Endonuclease/exonuclease/phosphatase domain-containing protein n=1 Tax=Luteipulveratus mongoliensis TaxID=571913 RepID=A0A0K1JGV4_9MICO|nr:hypothetical protein VV02_08835 [Luteipulveratus mongoliensis]
MSTEGPTQVITSVLRTGVIVGGVMALVGSAVLALLRSTDPGTTRLAELAAFAPVGLPLALVGVIAVALALRPSFGRAGLAIVVAGALLTCLHGWWLAPLYVASSPSGTGPAMVVMAQNLEYGDVSHVQEVAGRLDVDVLCLSDIGPDQLASIRATPALARAYPYSAGVTEEGTGGTIVMSRYPLSTTWSSTSGRSLTVKVSGPTGPTSVVAVHPYPVYETQAWHDDYAEIGTYLRRTFGTNPRSPVVIAGDFNASSDNTPFRRIVGIGYRDGAADTNAWYQPTWPAGSKRRTFGIPVPPLVTLDHVLASRALAITNLHTVRVSGADHRAVVATVRRAA